LAASASYPNFTGKEKTQGNVNFCPQPLPRKQKLSMKKKKTLKLIINQSIPLSITTITTNRYFTCSVHGAGGVSSGWEPVSGWVSASFFSRATSGE